MRIGFTGSREGMSEMQCRAFETLFLTMFKNVATQFHHGDCIGADTMAHTIVNRMRPSIIIIHPPSDPKQRAYNKAKQILEPDDYLVRNHAIVDQSDVLIACPKEDRELARSGTWATIRYARKRGIKVYHIKLDGTLHK